jgi:DNA adenine methylase
MKYMGSKNKIAKEIAPIMLAERKPGQPWVEPFVGGGNMIDRVNGPRIGSDLNSYVIEALLYIRDNAGNLPKNNTEFTSTMYLELHKSDTNPLKGYAGFAFSYSGKWLGGWRRDRVGKRDYVAESYRSAIKQSPLLKNVKLVNCSYDELDIPDRSMVYCDPPYAGTTKYKDNFDHDKFWEWCRGMAKKGHTVFISEYTAPYDFVAIWEKEVNSSLTKDTGAKKAVEKLFMYRGF